jgi:hypothetical protein
MLVFNAIFTMEMLPTYRLKYIEQEMAKKRGRELGIVEEEVKPAEDDLYIIPEHLKVFNPFQLNVVKRLQFRNCIIECTFFYFHVSWNGCRFVL